MMWRDVGFLYLICCRLFVDDLTLHHLLSHLDVVLCVATMQCQPSPLISRRLSCGMPRNDGNKKRITHWPAEKPHKKTSLYQLTLSLQLLPKSLSSIHSWTSISRCSSFAQNHWKSRIFQMYFLYFVLYLQSLWSQNKQPVLAPCLREWWCGGRLEKEAANLFTKSFPSFLFLQHWYFHHLSVKSDKRLDSGKETLYIIKCVSLFTFYRFQAIKCARRQPSTFYGIEIGKK